MVHSPDQYRSMGRGMFACEDAWERGTSGNVAKHPQESQDRDNDPEKPFCHENITMWRMLKKLVRLIVDAEHFSFKY